MGNPWRMIFTGDGIGAVVSRILPCPARGSTLPAPRPARPLGERVMPVEAPDDFAALLARARAGDSEAMTRLALQYEPKVRIVARVLLGPALRPHLDSMDLVNSVHRSLMVGLRATRFAISAPEALSALAVTLVRRRAARRWRHLRRQLRPDAGADGGQSLPDLLISLSSTEADPARQAELRD